MIPVIASGTLGTVWQLLLIKQVLLFKVWEIWAGNMQLGKQTEISSADKHMSKTGERRKWNRIPHECKHAKWLGCVRMCEHTCTQWQASEGKGCRSMRICKMHSSESCLVKRQRNRWFGGMTPFLIGHHLIPHHAEQQTEHGICLTAGSTRACSLGTEHLSPFKPDKWQENPSLMHNSFVLITPWCPCPTLGCGGFSCHRCQQGMRWGSWHQMLEGEGFPSTAHLQDSQTGILQTEGEDGVWRMLQRYFWLAMKACRELAGN